MNKMTHSESTTHHEKDFILLTDIINAIPQHKALVFFTISFFLCIGVLIAVISPSVYMSSSLVQVENNSQFGASFLSEVADTDNVDSNIDTDIVIMNSRLVLGPVVEDLQLDVFVEPLYLSDLGRFIASQRSLEDSAVLGLQRYAWGGEKIELAKLHLPATWLGRLLYIVAGETGKFTLQTEEGEVLAQGSVGTPLKVILAPGESIEFLISVLDARPGTFFQLRKDTLYDAVDRVKSGLSIIEAARGADVLRVYYESYDANKAAQIVDAITNEFVNQNISHHSSQTKKSLEFLETQLPRVKTELEVAEDKLNQFRIEHASVNLNEESLSLLESLQTLDDRIQTVKIKKLEYRMNYKENHPLVEELNKKINVFNRERTKLEKLAGSLPNKQQIMIRLSRDVQVNTEIYTKLKTISQELKVTQASETGNVRVLEYGDIPSLPVKPRRSIIVLVSLLLGIFTTCLILMLKKLFRQQLITSQEQIEDLGLPVISTIFFSKRQEAARRSVQQTNNLNNSGIIVLTEPQSVTSESFRSLRTSLQITMLGARGNAFVISGPIPGIGKSFVSINLGAALSAPGKRVLVLDADLRRGTLHNYLGVKSSPGITDYIDTQNDDIIHQVVDSNLFVLTRGSFTSDPAELFSSKRFEQTFQKLCQKFDYVLVDTPPVLAVSDAIVLTKLTGMMLMVVRPNVNDSQQVLQMKKVMQHSQLHVGGVVYNGATRQSSSNVYQYKYYKDDTSGKLEVV